MITDINLSLGRWPFQRFDIETPRQMAAHLRKHGIGEGWVCAADSVLYPDPDVYDERLFRSLSGTRNLHLVKTVNPTLANWRKSLRAWAGDRGVRAVKVYPNYHQYSLKDSCAGELAAELRRLRLPLMVAMRIEDERSHYPLMKVPGVPCKDVVALARAFPRVPVVALCSYLHEARALTAGSANIHVDTSFIEAMDTLKAAAGAMPARRILFGSHTPFFYTRAETMKLGLANISRRAWSLIARDNAQRIFKASVTGSRRRPTRDRT